MANLDPDQNLIFDDHGNQIYYARPSENTTIEEIEAEYAHCIHLINANFDNISVSTALDMPLDNDYLFMISNLANTLIETRSQLDEASTDICNGNIPIYEKLANLRDLIMLETINNKLTAVGKKAFSNIRSVPKEIAQTVFEKISFFKNLHKMELIIHRYYKENQI